MKPQHEIKFTVESKLKYSHTRFVTPMRLTSLRGGVLTYVITHNSNTFREMWLRRRAVDTTGSNSTCPIFKPKNSRFTRESNLTS